MELPFSNEDGEGEEARTSPAVKLFLGEVEEEGIPPRNMTVFTDTSLAEAEVQFLDPRC